jgi:integrase
MARQGKRRRIAPQIYADKSGYSAVAKIGDRQREKRFRPSGDVDTDIRRMQRWQLRTRAELLGDRPTRPQADTLASDVPRFLATITAGTPRRDYEKLLAAWLATPLGERPRRDIRRRDVLTQIAAWEADGYSAATLNHRLRALRKLYDVLDGDDEDAINPCAKIRKRSEPEPEARGTTYDIIEGILALIPDIGYTRERGQKRPTFNKSKIRLRVMAWTGLPPALIRQITADHIHWNEAELDVTPRRKGKGVKARRLPLLEEAVSALRDLAAADALGPYSNAAPWNTWDRAKRRYIAQLRESETDSRVVDELVRVIEPLRPYDLRHSFAAMVYEHSGGNRSAVSDLLMHAALQTSERYVKRAVAAVSRRALATVAAKRRELLDTAPSSLSSTTAAVPSGAIVSTPNGAVSRRKRTSVKRAQSGEKRAKRANFSKKRAD